MTEDRIQMTRTSVATTSVEKHRSPAGSDTASDRGTAEALLSAAGRLFAERGYVGTSIRAITAAAGANLGAVTYHFGSKQALYRAMLERLLAPIGDEIRAAEASAGTPLERIHRAVEGLLRYLGRNPERPRLLLQEISTSPLPDPLVQRTMKSNLLLLRSLVEEGQRDGSIREGDPLLLALSLLSQPAHMSVVLRPLHRMMRFQEDEGVLLDRLAPHAADFAVRALEVRREVS
jgi:AcrR family transcriptional regulator